MSTQQKEPKVIDVPASPTKEESQQVLPSRPIEAQPGGVLVPSTLEDQFRLARYYHYSGLMPRGLDTTEKVLVALQMCFELGLPPITSVGKIAVINGTPSIFGDLPLALCLKSGKLLESQEWWFDKDGNKLPYNAPIEKIGGASCMVHRHGMEPITRSFTVDDAKLARLWGKVGSSGAPTPWILYPKRMLQMRARSWALKDRFGDVLMGISILEYDHNAMMVDGRLVTDSQDASAPKKDVSQELNDAYLSKAKEKEEQGGVG